VQSNIEFYRQKIDARRLPPQVVEKWSSSVLEEGFVPFPKKLVRCLTQLFTGPDAATEMAVVLAVVDFKRPNVSRNPSLEYLSFLAGLEVAVFNEALTRLILKGYVKVGYGPDGLDVSLDGLLTKIEELTREVPK
jgi:hypothetical protein